MYRPKYFTLPELCKSSEAIELGTQNVPNFNQVTLLLELCEYVLDPIRELAEAPIFVNSGYRNADVNKAVGGVIGSYHRCVNGYAAADITRGNKYENKKLFKAIAESDIPYQEMILEKGGAWIHIAYWNKGADRETIG